MCDKHARCGHCIHEACTCSSFGVPKFTLPDIDLDWHEEADAVGYWQTNSKSPLVRKTLVKKTNYPRSFSLTNTQYAMAVAGRFNGVTIVDARTGAQLFVENEFGLRDVLKTAVPKTTIDGVIYLVVRF